MKEPMTLTGDANVPAMPLTDAQVNHLRQLLAWMRVEYYLDPSMQEGYLEGTMKALDINLITQEQADVSVGILADRVTKCPAYVRQAVKMLTKALQIHETKAGVVDADSGDAHGQ